MRYLGVTYELYLYLVGKPEVDFPFVTTELRRYKQKSVEVAAF